MTGSQGLIVKSELTSLPQVLDYVRQACQSAGLGEDAVFACELAADEACSNIIEHAYEGRPDGEIRIKCEYTDTGFVLRFHDHGKPFDPTLVPDPKLTGALSERSEGGLGLHFMRSVMDEVHFEFDAVEGNTLTMVKRVSAEETPGEVGG